MDDDYQNPLPRKTYISPSLKAFGDKDRTVRIASKIMPSEDGYEYARERDEVVLRKKPDAKTYITAKFLEDTRANLRSNCPKVCIRNRTAIWIRIFLCRRRNREVL